ncbi:NAD(P)/FAD-dependent oxidoreductase [Candidatus Poriferisodalis sp.]|uniref:NAD(P)/FAD-dependent oxidoreductase n=1 Tax=Candidatus Poriferisodalis sp. TaxID=3101277 RepID=UPI003D14C090
MPTAHEAPLRDTYDVVIVGGAVIGSSIAWALSANEDFDGTVLVVERDPSYAQASTSLTNSCMRQQFSNPLNVQISRFGADFVRNFRERLGGDPEIPDLFVHHFGYMYLAGDEDFAATLRRNQAIQSELGAGTRIMSPAQIKADYPFYNVDDIVCGSHNLVDEGYFDSGTMFDWWRRKARQNGVEYVTGEVADLVVQSGRVDAVVLASGETVRSGALVNAAGPRAVDVAAMAGATLPVEPRKRYTFIFEAAEPLDRALPLTIDPTGVHMRSDGAAYMCGCTPDVDPAVDYDDFSMDRDIFEDKVWPVLVHRVPAFERLKVTSQWAGHYAYNTLDHNVVVGPHHEVGNFIFANGFSGHGMQQSPAIGRAVSEWIAYGEYRTLDLTPLGYQRIVENRPFVESAII